MICQQETKLALIPERDVISFLGIDFRQLISLLFFRKEFMAWRLPGHQQVDSTPLICLGPICYWRWFNLVVQGNIYGPHQDSEKVAWWAPGSQSLVHGPWCLWGDFNMIYSAEDKNNKDLNRAMIWPFQWFVNDFELKEIPLIGRWYTQSNEREAPTLVKLDRILCTADWEALYPECILQSQATEISDHCPLVLGLTEGIHGKRRFHFECFWTKLPGFHDAVAASRHRARLTQDQAPHPCSPILESTTSWPYQNWTRTGPWNSPSTGDFFSRPVPRIMTTNMGGELVEARTKETLLVLHHWKGQ